MKVSFKSVGQGDSIVLEWNKDGVNSIGIIDIKKDNTSNPVLDYLKASSYKKIEFIILSHFHEDHFSGIADVILYCESAGIEVVMFLHSIDEVSTRIYDKILTSQKLDKTVSDFFDAYDNHSEGVILAQDRFSTLTRIIELNKDIKMEFLAPNGDMYQIFKRQLARKVNVKYTVKADINNLASVILLYNDKDCVLLTSDAIKKSFARLRDRIKKQVVLAQVPHHGSKYNLDERFWLSISKVSCCPAVFSVGDEPKDKLPDIETVIFFDVNGFDVHSTDSVYGISQYFKTPISVSAIASPRSAILNGHSRLRRVISSGTPNAIPRKYKGDQNFDVL